MDLFDMIISYIRDEKFEKIKGSEGYKAAESQKNEMELELVMSLTKKQRRMFHEYIQQREAMASMELAYLLKDCTLVVSPRPCSPAGQDDRAFCPAGSL